MTRTVRTLLINDFDEQVQIVIREVCRRVGANPEEIDFGPKESREDEWYNIFTWSSAEENEFIEWFVDYLYHNAKARKAFGIIGRSRKACIDKGHMMTLYCWNHKKIDSK